VYALLGNKERSQKMKTLYLTKDKENRVELWAEEPKLAKRPHSALFACGKVFQPLASVGCATLAIQRVLNLKLKKGEIVTLKIQIGRPRKGKKKK